MHVPGSSAAQPPAASRNAPDQDERLLPSRLSVPIGSTTSVTAARRPRLRAAAVGPCARASGGVAAWPRRAAQRAAANPSSAGLFIQPQHRTPGHAYAPGVQGRASESTALDGPALDGASPGLGRAGCVPAAGGMPREFDAAPCLATWLRHAAAARRRHLSSFHRSSVPLALPPQAPTRQAWLPRHRTPFTQLAAGAMQSQCRAC